MNDASNNIYVGMDDVMAIHIGSLCADDSEYWYDVDLEGLEEDGDIWFPDPRMGMGDGTRCPLCVGGDLSPERLQLAYSYGIFPWSDFRLPEIHWYGPTRRFVLFPEKVHISHSMRTLINKGRYYATYNQALPEVARHCSTVDQRDQQRGAWLGPKLIESLEELWKRRVVVSVEVYDSQDGDRLVGGLYGYWIKDCFLGDSMFSLVPSASKLALIALCQRLEKIGGKMIDLQIYTPHLASMGGEFLDYYPFLQLLNPEAAAKIDPFFKRPFRFDWQPSEDGLAVPSLYIENKTPDLLFISN